MIHKNSNDPEPETGILLYLHCKKCLSVMPAGSSPKEWSMTQAGLSPEGNLIVWCNRHNILVCRFQGSPAMQQLVGHLPQGN